jgi:hypothetical protein
MSQILEWGDAYFFYRPHVGVDEVTGLADDLPACVPFSTAPIATKSVAQLI